MPAINRPSSGLQLRRMRSAMGTLCVIETTAPDENSGLRAIRSAFDVIQAIALRMHPTNAGSDIAAINGARSDEQVCIAPSTWHVLSLSREIHLHSAGVFDVCSPVQPGRTPDLSLQANNMVGSRRAVAIDLGGIAKGYAVDQAVERLIDAGCTQGLVNLGGDLRVFGEIEQDMGVRLPSGEIHRLALRDRALAVSAVENPDRPPEHRGYYSRLEGRELCATFALVLAAEAAVADALTKCALICSDEEMVNLAATYGANWLRLP